MEENKISVVLPVYNCANFINKCLESLKNQTYNNIEVIIVDDGSTDSTAEEIKRFIKNNKLANFYYNYQKNSGVSSARNNGIEKSTGKLLMFVDSDDWLSDECIEILYKSLMKEKCQLAVSNYTNVKPDGEEIINKFMVPKKSVKKTFLLNILSPSVSNAYEKNIFNCSRTVWAKLYIKEIIEKNNIRFKEEIKLLEDGLFNLEYVKMIDNITYVDKSLYFYFDNSCSASKKFYPDRMKEDLKKMDFIENIIDDSDKDLKNAKQVLYINLFFSSMQKSLFNRENNISLKEKRKKLVELINSHQYKNIFDKSIYKYLNLKKRIILTCLKLKMYYLISFLFKII